MTASEAIKELQENIDLPFGSNVSKEAAKIAMQALAKQEKIKEVFTHYAFSGNELDVLNDCISALSEIKAILKE